MAGGAQSVKRIPRIKFPKRRPAPRLLGGLARKKLRRAGVLTSPPFRAPRPPPVLEAKPLSSPNGRLFRMTRSRRSCWEAAYNVLEEPSSERKFGCLWAMLFPFHTSNSTFFFFLILLR